MDECVSISAYAKLNLTLSVLYRRADGYHELDGIMCETDICDDVAVFPHSGVDVAFDVAVPRDNTARRAAEAFLALTGRGSRVEIKKGIPSEAGMGGASADAAAVLRGLSRLYGIEIPRPTLLKIGREIGADVPFALTGGFCRAGGVGERLTPLADMELDILVAKPERGVSTRALFTSLSLPCTQCDTDGAIAALACGDKRALSARVGNSLYASAASQVKEIAQYVSRMTEYGALGASMTGSGSAVFGIFESKHAANAAQARFSDAPYTRVCTTARKYV